MLGLIFNNRHFLQNLQELAVVHYEVGNVFDP